LNWEKLPIWSLYRRVDMSGRPDLPLLSVYRDHGVVLRKGRQDNYNRPGADLSRYKVVSKGDLVINKMKTWQGSLGVSAFDGIVSPAYFVANRIGDVDDRFMHHLLRSRPLIAEYGARSKGIRPAQWDLPWDEFASIKVRLPSAATQRAIADYLDTETSRIDTLITKKRRMIELLDERQRTVITRALRTARQHGERRPLRAYAEVQLGRQRSPQYDRGPYMTPYLRAANVKDGVLNLSDIKSMNFKPAEQDRFALLKGDVLVSEGSGSLIAVGASAVWNAEIKGTVCFQNTLLRLRPRPSTDPRFLAWWCRYAHTDGLFANIATGANIYHVSADRVRSIPMNHVPLVEQKAIVEHLDAETSLIATTRTRQQRALNLLAERRQALITAAVMGGYPIPVDDD
jgi:type I restriction enzyme S subunit